jgi:prolipoprotein diacylglyceryl transferase
MALSLATHIPSPPANGFHVGPLYIHFYGLMYVVGIALAIYITRRRWRAAGGDPTLVTDVATWAVPAGIIGGRIYFDITTPFDIRPHTWWGVFAVWNGGLGIWGGIAAGVAVGIWRVHRAGADWRVMCDAVAPALLVAQAIGRVGNYFNQELFGKPTGLPWGLQISQAARQNSGIPAADMNFTTFQPSFLYELIFDLALAALLVWLGHHRKIRPPGLLALYIAGYSAYRIFEETIRIDSSAHFLGLRLNMFIAIVVTIAGLTWFVLIQRGHGAARLAAEGAGAAEAATGATADTSTEGAEASSQPGDTSTEPAEASGEPGDTSSKDDGTSEAGDTATEPGGGTSSEADAASTETSGSNSSDASGSNSSETSGSNGVQEEAIGARVAAPARITDEPGSTAD